MRAVFGLKAGLDAQVAEKRRLKELQKQSEAFSDMQNEADNKMDMYREQVELKNTRTARERALNVYRSEQQGKATSDLADILYPEAGGGSRKASTVIGEPTDFSVAQVGAHDGERTSRTKAVQQTQQADLAAQIVEKDAAKMTVIQSEATEAAAALTAEELAAKAAAEQQQRRRAAQIECAAYNRRAAEVNRQRKIVDHHRKWQSDADEIQFTVQTDFLSENPAATVNVHDPNRWRPDHMKGISAHHRSSLVAYQHQQQLELKSRKQQEVAADRQFARQQQDHVRSATLLDRHLTRQRRANIHSLTAERQAQAEEAAHRRAVLASYRNEIDDAFWSGFSAGQ